MKVSALYVTGNSLVRRKVWAPKRRPPRLPLAAPSHSYFSCESRFTGPSRVSSFGFLVFPIFSLSSRDLDVSVPSFCWSLVVWGREIKNAHRWSCGAEKIKCCYQLRVVRNMSILKRGARDTYTSVGVLALVCDCLSTEALRAAIC